MEFIRTSNLLDDACTLREGFPILLGVAAPPTATSPSGGAPATPTPTATPEPGKSGTAQICVLVYNDINGDGLRQETEPAIPGAALSLTNPEGTFSQTKITEINPDATAYQGMCFKDIIPGKYNISAAAPEGYNPTVDLTSSFDVIAGDEVLVALSGDVIPQIVSVVLDRSKLTQYFEIAPTATDAIRRVLNGG